MQLMLQFSSSVLLPMDNLCLHSAGFGANSNSGKNAREALHGFILTLNMALSIGINDKSKVKETNFVITFMWAESIPAIQYTGLLPLS